MISTSCSRPGRPHSYSSVAAPSFLEALEPRIAPAVIIVGQAGAFEGQSYTDVPANPNALRFEAAVDAPIEVGDPAIFTALDTDHYYIDLKGNDIIRMLNPGGPAYDFVKVLSGRAYAFFYDINGDGIVQPNEFTGLVLSTNTRVEVNGSIDGDVLATLDARTGLFSTDDLINNRQNIGGLTVTGTVNGNIVAGGNISNVFIGQSVDNIFSGTPTGPLAYSLGGTGSGTGDGTIANFDPGLRGAGGNITNVSVGNFDSINAGNGGAGGKGGNVTNVTVLSDDSGFSIIGGNGGDGELKAIAGGAGGNVSKVLVFGVADTTPNDQILIAGGNGGDGFATNGRGGVGGNVSNISIGYETVGKGQLVVSPVLLQDDILISGGMGGAGFAAGNGGSLLGINIVAAPPENGAPTAEIQLIAGDAGAFLDPLGGQRAGKGGDVNKFDIVNFDPDVVNFSSILVQAGNATASNEVTPLLGIGANGGSVLNGKILGFAAGFYAGNGSDTATKGGNGGSINNIAIDYLDFILARELDFVAGEGGLSGKGAGGNGGDIIKISAPLTSLNSFEVSAGDGGESQLGFGGKGGKVSGVEIFDFDAALVPSIVDVKINAGDGADGGRKGGFGGSVDGVSFFSSYASLSISAGDGGDTTGAMGAGGAGGSISKIAFFSEIAKVDATATLQAGDGGDSAGSQAAGAGGSITIANLQTAGDVAILAGVGGDGQDKAAVGKGGSVGSASAALGIFALSSKGSVTISAGNAGDAQIGFTPTRAAAGGSVINVAASALSNITVTGGDGKFGGAGGDINRLAFYGVLGGNPNPGVAPSGNILINAGHGGDASTPNGSSGNGGSLTSITGYTSEDDMASVEFTAGNGGVGGNRGGNGGSITTFTILDGKANFSVVAGHGGDANRGGVGGSVNGVNVGANVIVRAVAAGDGGDSLQGRGGNGGSVNNINVASTIGIRSDVEYGFSPNDDTKMGGIFAGVGGNFNDFLIKNHGTAGSVTNVTAQAISAIVAGRDASPQLVNRVDKVYLGGFNAPQVDVAGPGGAFVNFPTANVVGGKSSNPAAAGAVRFEAAGAVYYDPAGTGYAWDLGVDQPLDGLVAALTLTANRNFTPLAFLTNLAPRPLIDPPDIQLFVPSVATA